MKSTKRHGKYLDKLCIYDGRVEGKHMGRHYETHHNDLAKIAKKVVVLDRYTISKV